jgi:hypothetical protein
VFAATLDRIATALDLDYEELRADLPGDTPPHSGPSTPEREQHAYPAVYRLLENKTER